ncbi:MoaD/ThiS family protein [Mucilaginibacter sp. AW1-3]
MTIQVFAVLKEHFDKEFEVGGDIHDIATLKDHLLKLNAEAGNILQISRFAVNNEFVNLDYAIKSNDTICIFPPSSGG